MYDFTTAGRTPGSERNVTNDRKTHPGQSKHNHDRRQTAQHATTGADGRCYALLASSSRRAIADIEATPNDPFIVLLHGIYQAVFPGQGPAGNLGLRTVNLSDGSYSKTQIYPIFAVDGANDQKKAIGSFFVQFAGNLCAYDLPGGSIAMQFLPAPKGAPAGFNGFAPFPDGAGGVFLEGTFE